MVLFFADLIQNSLWIVNSTINLKKKLWGSWSGHHKVQANYKLNLVLYSHFSCTLLSLKSLWKALSWGMWSKWNLLLTVQIFTQIFLLHVQHCWQKALWFSQWELCWRKATGITLILAGIVSNSCCSLAAKGEGKLWEREANTNAHTTFASLLETCGCS